MGEGIEGDVVSVRIGLGHFSDSQHRDPTVRDFDNTIFAAQYDRGSNTGATVCVPESCYSSCGKLSDELGNVALKVLKSAGSGDEFTYTISCDGWRRFRSCQSLTDLYRIGRIAGITTTDRPYHGLRSGTARDYAMRAVINFGAKPTNLVEAARKVRTK